jgi:thiol-disulfide isomerase/thioredoxin
MAAYWRAALLCLMVCVAGCETGGTATPVIGDATDLNWMIAEQRGKVVLVDFWATWCTPCVEGFPHTVGLANKYRGQGLAAISVSLDDPADFVKVNRFLVTQKANFPHLISKYGGGTDSMDAFELDAAVPHYRLYDRAGKLRYQWNGMPDDLEEKVEELLAEQP